MPQAACCSEQSEMQFRDIPANNLATNSQPETERLGRVVTLQNFINGELCSNLSRDTDYAERSFVIFLSYSKQIPEGHLD
jgi:hypothetical protein